MVQIVYVKFIEIMYFGKYLVSVLRSVVRVSSFKIIHVLIFIIVLVFGRSLILALDLGSGLFCNLGFLHRRLTFACSFGFGTSRFLLSLLEALLLCKSFSFGCNSRSLCLDGLDLFVLLTLWPSSHSSGSLRANIGGLGLLRDGLDVRLKSLEEEVIKEFLHKASKLARC